MIQRETKRYMFKQNGTPPKKQPAVNCEQRAIFSIYAAARPRLPPPPAANLSIPYVLLRWVVRLFSLPPGGENTCISYT